MSFYETNKKSAMTVVHLLQYKQGNQSRQK